MYQRQSETSTSLRTDLVGSAAVAPEVLSCRRVRGWIVKPAGMPAPPLSPSAAAAAAASAAAWIESDRGPLSRSG